MSENNNKINIENQEANIINNIEKQNNYDNSFNLNKIFTELDIINNIENQYNYDNSLNIVHEDNRVVQNIILEDFKYNILPTFNLLGLTYTKYEIDLKRNFSFEQIKGFKKEFDKKILSYHKLNSENILIYSPKIIKITKKIIDRIYLSIIFKKIINRIDSNFSKYQQNYNIFNEKYLIYTNNNSGYLEVINLIFSDLEYINQISILGKNYYSDRDFISKNYSLPDEYKNQILELKENISNLYTNKRELENNINQIKIQIDQYEKQKNILKSKIHNDWHQKDLSLKSDWQNKNIEIIGAQQIAKYNNNQSSYYKANLVKGVNESQWNQNRNHMLNQHELLKNNINHEIYNIDNTIKKINWDYLRPSEKELDNIKSLLSKAEYRYKDLIKKYEKLLEELRVKREDVKKTASFFMKKYSVDLNTIDFDYFKNWINEINLIIIGNFMKYNDIILSNSEIKELPFLEKNLRISKYKLLLSVLDPYLYILGFLLLIIFILNLLF